MVTHETTLLGSVSRLVSYHCDHYRYVHSIIHDKSDEDFEAKKELILFRRAETRAKRRNRGILMYVCMWRTADPLENTGRLSLHFFVLWPFCDWPVVSADCLPQLPWRGKALEGMDGNCQSGGEKEHSFDDPIMCLRTLPLEPPRYRMLFCFSPLSFRNPKYAITEDCRNVPSVSEACSLGPV